MIVVYLSNQQIQVVRGYRRGGHIKVQGLYYTVDTKGCVMNGTITDRDAFAGLIRGLWERHRLPKKGICLVTNSNQFTSKVTQIPGLTKKRAIGYLKREFADVGRIRDPVFTWFSLGRENTRKVETVYATAAPREYLTEMLTVFADLGIKIDIISDAVGCVIRALRLPASLKKETAIIQFIDGITLLNILIVNGRYEYSDHVRLFETPGTPEFAIEVARCVGDLLQFAKANGLFEHLRCVYIAGLSKKHLAVYDEHIPRQEGELFVENFVAKSVLDIKEDADDNKSFSNFALPIAGLMGEKSEGNLLAHMERPEKGAGPARRKAVLFAAAAAAFLVAAGLLQLRVLADQTELDALAVQGDLQDINAQLKAYDARAEENEILKNRLGLLDEAAETILAYPRLDGTLRARIARCVDGLVEAKISSYDSETGVLTFDTKALAVLDIHKFAARLAEEEIFRSVDYSGYTQDGSDGSFHVNVTCVMEKRQVETGDE